MSVPQVIMGTLSFLGAAARLVIVTTTSTCMTPDPATSVQAPVSNVCTTRRATHASTASRGITAMLQHRAAGVGIDS